MLKTKSMVLAGALLIAAILMVAFTAIPTVGIRPWPKYIVVIGHRGAAAYAPENTLASFELAIEMGADYIECDIHLSKDGHLIVIHDDTVDRTTDGTGYVQDLTLEEIKKLDAGSWFSPEFAGEPVPTFEEVLYLAKNRGVKVAAEIKQLYVYYYGIEEKVVRAIEEYDMVDQVLVHCFDHGVIKTVEELNRDLETAILFSNGLLKPWKDAEFAWSDGIHLHRLLLLPEYSRGPEIIRECHKRGLLVWTWTVNTREEMLGVALMEVDGITSDKPDVVLEILHDLGLHD